MTANKEKIAINIYAGYHYLEKKNQKCSNVIRPYTCKIYINPIDKSLIHIIYWNHSLSLGFQSLFSNEIKELAIVSLISKETKST